MNILENNRKKLNNYINENLGENNYLTKEITLNDIKNLGVALGLVGILSGCAGNIRKDTGAIYGNEGASIYNAQRQLTSSTNILANFRDISYENENSTTPLYKKITPKMTNALETEMKHQQYRNLGIAGAVDAVKAYLILQGLDNGGGSSNHGGSSSGASTTSSTIGNGNLTHTLGGAIR